MKLGIEPTWGAVHVLIAASGAGRMRMNLDAAPAKPILHWIDHDGGTQVLPLSMEHSLSSAPWSSHILNLITTLSNSISRLMIK